METGHEEAKAALQQLGYACYNYLMGQVSDTMINDKISSIQMNVSKMLEFRRSGDVQNEQLYSDAANKEIEELGLVCYQMWLDGHTIGNVPVENFEEVKRLMSNPQPVISETEPEFKNVVWKSVPEAEPISEFPVNQEISAEEKDDTADFSEEVQPASEADYDSEEWERVPDDGVRCGCGYINHRDWNFCQNCGTRLK